MATPSVMPLRGSGQALATGYDVALLDLDGVVYVGPDAVPGAAGTLEAARALGMRLAFVTNNASRTPDTVAAHLTELAVPARPEDVVTSAQAAARVVAQLVPAGAAVLVVGGEGLRAALQERGLRPVFSADADPQAVVQGFAADVDWAALTEGALALARGVPWVAANLDATIPLPRGRAPGNGALVAALSAATGRRPDAVAGKPELPLHRESVERCAARHPIVVGDRLDTDIEGAVRGGTDSLLVFTGVTTAVQLLRAPVGRRPTYLAADLAGLVQPHPEVTPSGEGWRCRGWRASIDRGALALAGDGAPYDGLRAACAATWVAEEAVEVSAIARLDLTQSGQRLPR